MSLLLLLFQNIIIISVYVLRYDPIGLNNVYSISTVQDEVLVGKERPVVLSVNAPKEVSAE